MMRIQYQSRRPVFFLVSNDFFRRKAGAGCETLALFTVPGRVQALESKPYMLSSFKIWNVCRRYVFWYVTPSLKKI
jgi:hypothetical protein